MTTAERVQGLEEALRRQERELRALYTQLWLTDKAPGPANKLYAMMQDTIYVLDKYGTR